MHAVKSMFVDSGRALKSVYANPGLRRIELGRLAAAVAVSAYAIVFAVVAYGAGGAAALGLVAAVRMFAVSLASPFASLLGDRFARKRVMIVSDIVRAVVLVAAALAAAAGPATLVVVGLAALASLTGTASGPARAALMPAVARTPDELAAANVAGTTTESLAYLLGPALGGLLLALSGADVAFALTAVLCLLSAAVVAGIAVDEGPRGEPVARRRSLSREAFKGFRAVVAQPGARVVVALYAVECLAAGVFGVTMVATVIDLLELGNSGVGFASAIMSVGGLAGAIVALALGGRRLASALGAGVLLWGAAVALAGAWPEAAVVLPLLAFAALGDTVADAAGITVLQRTIPDEVLSRAFGALAMILWGAAALGAILAPALIDVFGLRGTLAVAGLPVAALALLALRSLRRVDATTGPGAVFELLRRVPLLAPLPLATADRLAAAASSIRVHAGDSVFRQGDRGDFFYVVETGALDVSVDGREIARLGPGDSFGEIALLRDVARTATVTAREDGVLYTLARDEFVPAVTGDAAALEAANAVIGSRLAGAVEVAATR